MVIRVLDQNYFVLQTLPSETGLLQYVCKNVAEDDGHVYRIVMVPSEQTDKGLIGWLFDIWQAGRFHELRQYASERDRLKVVVDCGAESAVPMADMLDTEPLSLKERIHMGGKLLERLILSDVPDFFAVHSLDPEHVCFTENLDCSLRFELEYLTEYDEADLARVFHRLRAVLRRLFAGELREKKMPELKELLDRILQQEFSDMMEVYRAWLPIADKYAGMDEERLEPKTLGRIVWDKVMALLGFLKKWVGVAIVLIAVAYLVLAIRAFTAPTKQMDVYQSVGNMTIISGQSAETEGKHE